MHTYTSTVKNVRSRCCEKSYVRTLGNTSNQEFYFSLIEHRQQVLWHKFMNAFHECGILLLHASEHDEFDLEIDKLRLVLFIDRNISTSRQQVNCHPFSETFVLDGERLFEYICNVILPKDQLVKRDRNAVFLNTHKVQVRLLNISSSTLSKSWRVTGLSIILLYTLLMKYASRNRRW